MTILTDDERGQIQTDACMHSLPVREALVVLTEAAVLAKLREQEPVAWMDAFGNVFPLGAQRGPKHLNEPMKPLYTTPLPVVVQVPREQVNTAAWDLLHAIKVVRDARAGEENWNDLDAKGEALRAALQAAPEAPAQAVSEREAKELLTFLDSTAFPREDLDLGLVRRVARAALAQQPAAQERPCKYNGGTCKRRGCKAECQGSRLVAQAQAIPAAWVEAVKVAFGEIAWSNDSKWQADRARAALAQLDALKEQP